jgi:hypothetical protein
MTSYDPFSYGTVHLDADQQQGVTAAEADDLMPEAQAPLVTPTGRAAREVYEPPQASAAAAPFVEDGLAELVQSPCDAALAAPAGDAPASTPARRASRVLPPSRSRPALTATVPFVTLASGWGAAAWLWTAQSNPVLAAIAAAATAVGALLSWLLLRG